MANVNYEIEERHQKLQIKSYGLLCLILLVSMGFYTFKNWQDYSLSKEGAVENKKYIEILREKTSEEKAAYEKNKPASKQLSMEMEKNLSGIFPVNDDYTPLTRQLDNFETSLSKKNSVFEISNIEYQTVQALEKYSVLPFRMTIRSSKENFEKFLHMIENSGSLSTDVRLMEISSIRINFGEGSDNQQDQLLNFSIEINAYFQKSDG